MVLRDLLLSINQDDVHVSTVICGGYHLDLVSAVEICSDLWSSWFQRQVVLECNLFLSIIKQDSKRVDLSVSKE